MSTKKFAPTKFPAFEEQMQSMLSEMRQMHDSTPIDQQSDEFYRLFKKYGCI